MADIPIHNETDYALTEAMTQDILRDAQEHFGEAIHAIRVQSGLVRHALNARWTRTMRKISWIRRMRRINGSACLLSRRGERSMWKTIVSSRGHRA